MLLAERIDEFGKVGWIAAMVMGFWFFWPIGLAVLMFLYWSGRIHGWRSARRGRWYNMERPGQPAGAYAQGRWGQAPGDGPRWSPPWMRGCGSGRPAAPPSGNHAFDDYRTETLRRLEEEQREFVEYLERLRQAKDKAEFDQFMADRRGRPAAPEGGAAA